MHKWLSAVLVMALLSGCAEDSEDAADEAEQMLEQAADAVPLFITMADANLTLDGLVITEGQAINFTLSSEVNITAVTWIVESIQEAAANATADGNATAEGNATAGADGANATANATTRAEPVMLASGTGVPVNVSILPPAGNQTLVIRASAEGYSDHVRQYAIQVLAAAGELVDDVVEEADPCVGVPPQEGESWSGILGPGAANQGLSEEHPFDVAPCNTKLIVSISADAADPILRIHFPDGSTTDVDSNFVGGESFTYAPPGGVPEGSYMVEVRSYATVASPYDVSVSFE